jgi:hypothetical protein
MRINNYQISDQLFPQKPLSYLPNQTYFSSANNIGGFEILGLNLFTHELV